MINKILIFLLAMIIGLRTISIIMFFKKYLKTKQKRYEIIRDTIINKPHPEQKLLSELINHKKFKHEKDMFQNAVLTKLEAYAIVPTTIEKMMSPVQLYQANNPLWTCNLNINAIETILALDNQLQKHNITINEYIEEFIIDCKNGIQIEDTLNKLLEKQYQKLQKQLQEHTRILENQYKNLLQHQ